MVTIAYDTRYGDLQIANKTIEELSAKIEAIDELLENRPDHVRVMIKLHTSQMKLNCVKAVTNALKRHDEAPKKSGE